MNTKQYEQLLTVMEGLDDINSFVQALDVTNSKKGMKKLRNQYYLAISNSVGDVRKKILKLL